MSDQPRPPPPLLPRFPHQRGIYVPSRAPCAHRARNLQEFLLYQWGTPLQFLRLWVCDKRGGPNVVVLHRRLLRWIATPACSLTANTVAAQPTRPAERMLTP